MSEKTKFQECRELFEAALWSEPFRQYIDRAIEDIDFYEGRQWSQEDLDTLKSTGLRPVTVNQIAQRIDALSGKEAMTRTRFKYRSRSGKPEEVAMADDLSSLALFVQEKNRTSRILTECRHQARITGLSWHSYEVIDGRIVERNENPLEVVWDTRDHTPLLTNQGFVARVIWMSVEEAQLRFPDKKDEIEKATTTGAFEAYSPFGFGNTHGTSASQYKIFSLGSYWNEKDREIAVVEFQYREPKAYYTYATEEGLYETFNKKEAEENAIDKDNIVKSDGYKVHYTYFVGDIELESFEAPYQISPAKGLFLLTPTVFQRGMRDGVPVGLVHKAKDSQRLYNTKQAKINWLMAARQVIMDKGAVDDVVRLRNEINKPNAVIVKNMGKELRIDAHAQEISQHYQSLAVHQRDVQAAMGIYDEALGVETNAQSGVAIQKRQNASASTQLYSADGFQEAQHQIAEKLLGLLRSVFTERMAIDITDDEGIAKRIKFNETQKVDGKERKVNDIRLGSYDVVIEQIPDSDTMNEIAQQRMLELLQSGLPMEQWTIGVLDLWNVPKNATIRKEIEQGLQQKLAQLKDLQAQQQIGDARGAAPMSGGNIPSGQPIGMSR